MIGTIQGRFFCVAPCPSIPRIVPLLRTVERTQTGWIHTDKLKILSKISLHFAAFAALRELYLSVAS